MTLLPSLRSQRAARAFASSGQLHLPDHSEWQGIVNAPAIVRANGGAAIMRVHTGYRADHFWPIRRQQFEAAGAKVAGFYAYLVPQRSVADQAREFCDLVGFLKPGQFAMLDFEDPGFGGNLEEVANEWFWLVDSRLNYPGYAGSWAYSYGSFIYNHGLGNIWASPRPTVLASYQTNEPGSPGHSLWQHTSSGCIWLQIGAIGASGGCDCNIFNGNVNDLLHRVAGNAKPQPPQPQQPSHAPTVNRFAGYATIEKGSRDPRTGPLPVNVPYDPHDYPVHVLQYTINAVTGNPHRLTWDGVYGADTEDNVADFQRLLHAKVDGECGPETWAALSLVCDFKGL